MGTSRTATSLATVDTIYSADAIEFCPANDRLFACGTYQIEKSELDRTQAEGGAQLEEEVTEEPTVTRYGRCLLYQIDEEGRKLTERQRFDGPAILDMKWSARPHHGQTTLAIANAKGKVELHTYSSGTETLSLAQTIDCGSEETLCLSLDWSDRHVSTSALPTSIVVSLSNGDISLLAGETELAPVETWKAHDFEPWIAAFDCWDPRTIWTGGDDCKLKGWDTRQGFNAPTFANKRFEGGVTTMQSHPHRENLFAVGSYDATIRLFDTRNPLKPLATHQAPGGIWRLKWHPSPDYSERILVAAMHGGFSVVDFEGWGGEGKEAVRFEGHESLAYGVDWSRLKTGDGKDLVASCSFYDHRVHVWAV